MIIKKRHYQYLFLLVALNFSTMTKSGYGDGDSGIEKAFNTVYDAIYTTASNPVVTVVLTVCGPRMVNFICDKYSSLYLTEEEKKELIEYAKDQRILTNQQKELNKPMILLQKNPIWTEETLKQHIQETALRAHMIRENELTIAEREREEEKQAIQHSKDAIASASPEAREELQKMHDEMIRRIIKKRTATI